MSKTAITSGESPSDLTAVECDPAKAAELAARHGAVRISPPPRGPDGLLDFLGSIGALMFTDGETPVDGYPMLNIVTNAGRTTKPKSVFHSDTTYVLRPPAYSALIAVEVPDEGGATLFTDQYAALEALDADLRDDLLGAVVRHGPTDVPDTKAVWHPLIRRNPVSNRDALFLTSLPRCQKLMLADGTDRTDLLETLYHHSLTFQAPRRHVWTASDVILWDNRCTLHAADHSAVVGTRTLYRGLVLGEPPIAAA